MAEQVEAFIQRWSKAGGSERANYQLFLTELCSLLDLPQPEPAGDDTRDNAYVFERRVLIRQPDGCENNGFIDLYKRGSFVLEAKQTGKTLDSSGWDKAMLRAHNQADQYVRALPIEEGRPPFILITDVGRNIELYAEFSRSGATYTPYPDARTHRIRLEDLRKADVRERLTAVWLDPLSLDPSRRAARVTREIADQLARLAKSLEGAGHSAELVAGFLMRCLFTMFAEDVELLPTHAFTDLLKRLKGKPDTFAPMLENLWQTMNSGGFSPILEKTLLRFNGGLFADSRAIPLDRDQLDLLLAAASADWRFVEPAIFGTLLERALDPRERHKLGAHYTPRAYVERLVLPTILEPLRIDWREVQAAALAFDQQGKRKEAVAEIRAFHHHLCSVRVLDPACGSGNFLYVTLEHMKRLEGEVLNLLHDLGESQGLLELQGVTVDPHQFLGLEINPRAATIAEMVLWIGYLQWHFRTHGKVNPPEPVLRDFHNIENRDALITYERRELIVDETGRAKTRWDGITYKASPITGEPIPDESAQVKQFRFINPHKAQWPRADYIVGNPPFIGNKRMRVALGDGYVDAVRNTWQEVPESADFVMYWWHIAAKEIRASTGGRFGFITTNSLTQTFNRRVLETELSVSNSPISLAFAIPDHPWVDSSDGAQVRISMTVACAGHSQGMLSEVVSETPSNDDEPQLFLKFKVGNINADLSIGNNFSDLSTLMASSGLACPGVQLSGQGFIVSNEDAKKFSLDTHEELIKRYVTGKDIAQTMRIQYVFDTYGMSQDDLKEKFPTVYQWLLDRVFPERQQNPREKYRRDWWLHAEPRGKFRSALRGLNRYLVTSRTAKHRVFSFIEVNFLPETKILILAFDDAYHLGVLSSRIHTLFSWATGGWLGVGNDSTYNHSDCLEKFAFPNAAEEHQSHIRNLAEKIDAHRKCQQSQFPEITLTGMYNVLEKIRAGETLNAKEKEIHEQGLVSLLRELHDNLDRAVFAAYGWDDLAEKLVGKPGATTPLPDKSEAQAEAEEELLRRLVELNSQRATEEARGVIRWLRPDYQNPSATIPPQQVEAVLPKEEESAPAEVATAKIAWPKNMREQVAAVRNSLSQRSLSLDSISAQYKRSPKIAVKAVLDALEELGMVGCEGQLYRLKG